MTQIIYVRVGSAGLSVRMLAISDGIELPPSLPSFFGIGTENKHNATTPPCILLEVLLVTSWLRLRRRGNIQCLHESHWSSTMVELKGSIPVCHALQERQRWGLMKRYDTLHSVFLEFCAFIGCWDENHGNALKCGHEADVH